MAREATFIRRLKVWLEGLNGVTFRKLHGGPYSVIGDSDIVGCIQVPDGTSETGSRGLCFLIECKQIGKKPTPIQQARLRQWSAVGALCGYAATIDEAREILLPALRLRGDV